MKRVEKEQQIQVLHQQFQESKSTVLVDYKGLNVAEVTDLRNKLREVSVDFKVVKNTLSVLAAKGTELEKVMDHFQGPTATAMSHADPVAGIKVLNDFAQGNSKLEFKVALMDGAVFDKSQIGLLANLPSRDELMAKFLGTMQAPLSTFVRMMAAPMSGLLNVLNGIKESKAS